MKRKNPPFRGCGTALITPFTKDGIDHAAWKGLIDRQLEAGVDALIVLGTTGEPSTLSVEEMLSLVREAVSQTRGRVPVIVGVGGNNTAQSILRSKQVRDLGADCLLSVTPYYNKTTQAGLIAHYTALADATELPMILYNVPARTGLNLACDTMDVLADHPRIVALKEASADITQIGEFFARCHDRVALYSGCDDHVMAFMSLGGEGVISVLSNLLPKPMADMTHAYLKGDLETARNLQLRLYALARAIFWEVNPIPVKAAMYHLGLCEDTVRLPLVPMSEGARARLLRLVEDYPDPFV